MASFRFPIQLCWEPCYMSHIRTKMFNNFLSLQIWVPAMGAMGVRFCLKWFVGFLNVFPRWLPFIFPYSSGGSLAICPTLGQKFLTICRYGRLWCLICSPFWELVLASNDLLGFHKVFPWWLPFVFPYSSAGSLAICPTLGQKFLPTCRYGCLQCSICSPTRFIYAFSIFLSSTSHTLEW